MATHDYVIANGTGAAVRSDLNGALAAIVSNNSSATQPATMYAYQWWADTTTGLLKIRNSANSAWVTLFELDGTLVASDISLGAGTVGAPSLFFTGDVNTGLFSPGADTVALVTGGTNRVHVTSGGLVGIGTTGPGAALDAVGTINSQSNVSSIVHFQAQDTGAATDEKTWRVAQTFRSTKALGVGVAVNDASSIANAAILIVRSGAGIDNIQLSTSALVRMTIASTGDVLINKTAVNDTSAGFRFSASNYFSAVRESGSPGYINRLTDDGVLLEFAQDSTTEGTISVSGTTVSYNGAHLSRWSQLPGGATREEILRGTVLSNIDEMCGWGEEDNEQLNRMKVSDVEGDKNVSGVFQAWDDDDDTYTNDFYCAMTGDFIIRIAADISVERGDLLMSAGDGTAKPQDDDIIRSKTVAKVTSTNVTCTYEDGSYCVPCVLMAC